MRDRKRVLFYHPDLANNCKPLPGILVPNALASLQVRIPRRIRASDCDFGLSSSITSFGVSRSRVWSTRRACAVPGL